MRRWRTTCGTCPTRSSGSSGAQPAGLSIDYVREHTRRHLAALGASSQEIEAVKGLFDPDTLTIGFARRFATYKRPTLLLHDPERLLRILTSADRPVQLIVAGKAHPADAPGQAMIEAVDGFHRAARQRATRSSLKTTTCS